MGCGTDRTVLPLRPLSNPQAQQQSEALARMQHLWIVDERQAAKRTSSLEGRVLKIGPVAPKHVAFQRNRSVAICTAV